MSSEYPIKIIFCNLMVKHPVTTIATVALIIAGPAEADAEPRQ
ncbi:hypothetical protein T07_11765 [Trichinella nelsoni]|uniref:Uncharacterized protein n=1 Tax=Trichinella nelsoni TaxID=6336 RepID=A0A0V0RBW0_9BILA|nr:hypothetical protein T07_11765 [Trichinella nelsoni]